MSAPLTPPYLHDINPLDKFELPQLTTPQLDTINDKIDICIDSNTYVALASRYFDSFVDERPFIFVPGYKNADGFAYINFDQLFNNSSMRELPNNLLIAPFNSASYKDSAENGKFLFHYGESINEIDIEGTVNFCKQWVIMDILYSNVKTKHGPPDVVRESETYVPSLSKLSYDQFREIREKNFDHIMKNFISINTKNIYKSIANIRSTMREPKTINNYRIRFVHDLLSFGHPFCGWSNTGKCFWVINDLFIAKYLVAIFELERITLSTTEPLKNFLYFLKIMFRSSRRNDNGIEYSVMYCPIEGVFTNSVYPHFPRHTPREKRKETLEFTEELIKNTVKKPKFGDQKVLDLTCDEVYNIVESELRITSL